MKNIISSYLLIIICLVGFTSCTKKDLEIEPRNELPSEDAINNPDLMLAGIYSLLGSGGIENIQEGALYATDLILNADLLAGEQYISWSGTFSEYRQVRNKTMLSTNKTVVRIWRKAYSTINLANTLLRNLPANNADYYRAHALFARGIVHFELVRFYAKQYDPATAALDPGVPLMLTASQSFEEITSPSRASVQDVYAQVIKDLNDARELLPENNTDFITRQSISAFLSRVYLQKGDFNAALIAANDVIENDNYALAGKLTDVFNNNGSSEHVFVIEQTQNKNTGTANDGLITFYGCDPNLPAGTGRGDVNISSNFIEKYDSIDFRRNVLIYEGTCSKGSITTGKWRNPYTNIPIVRLAEMYLTRAECNFRLGSSIGASPLEDINSIRSRAGVNLYDESSFTLDTILLERELELAFEGFRIHDKRRTNASFEDEDDDGNPFLVNYREPQFIMPIPQVELNSNKNLVQNEGY